MRKKKGSSGLVAAGLGWGLAAGMALGVLLVAPALQVVNDGHAAPGAEAEVAGSGQAADASAQAAAADELLASRSSELVDAALDGASVGLVRTSAVPDEAADKQRWLLNKAGADDAGSIVLTEKFTSQEAADELSSIIANTLPAGASLSVENRSPGVHAGEAFAAALTADTNGQPRASVQDREFLLETLAEAGFIEFEPGSVIPADGFVIMTTTDSDEDTFGRGVLESFADAFHGVGSPVVVASPGPADSGSAVPAVGFSGSETGRLNTVFTLRDELRAHR